MKRGYIGGLIMIFLSGCGIFRTTQPEGHNMAYLYQPAMNALHPRYIVYHQSPEKSSFTFRLMPAELYFSQANEEVVDQAVITVHYNLFLAGESRILTDSATVMYFIKRENVIGSFVENIEIPAQRGNKYILELITTDMLRDVSIQSYLVVDKRSTFSSQNFFPIDHNTRQPMFFSYADTIARLNLLYGGGSIDSVFVRYHRGRYQPSRPPNLILAPETISYSSDSTWAIPYSENYPIRLSMPGVYHFQVDTNQADGFTFFNWGGSFPMVRYADEMIQPLDYLATTPEYNELLDKPNIKLSIDDFWLETAGNMETAKELIRVYYNRIFFANHYFSSYKEGWKTDRGMIYTIYGPPTLLYKTDETEEWIYGRPDSEESIEFLFRRQETPYTYNHYLLDRGEALVTKWSQAIESWRKGRVYNVEF